MPILIYICLSWVKYQTCRQVTQALEKISLDAIHTWDAHSHTDSTTTKVFNLHVTSVSSSSRSRPCFAFGLRSHWVDWQRAPHRRIQCGQCVQNLWDYRSLIDRCAGVGGAHVVARAIAAVGNSRRTIAAKSLLWMPFFVLASACGQSYCWVLRWCQVSQGCQRCRCQWK